MTWRSTLLMLLALQQPITIAGFTPQPPPDPGTKCFTREQYWGLHQHAELRAVYGFLEEADRLGIETPLDYSTMRLHTKLLNDA